jgi:ubiquitin carboxyl-terminal hydrolase MINDY-1/2
MALEDSDIYETAENPWSESPANNLRSDPRPLPDILKPGTSPSRNEERLAPVKYSLADIPNALRAGRSQENTPRSSLDSDRSKDFWEDSDDEGKASPKKGKIALQDSDPIEDPWVNVEAGGIKRKPVGSGLTPTHTRPEPNTSNSFASNNPFRRPSENSAGEASIQRLNWTGDSANAKGKEPVQDADTLAADYFQGLSTGGNSQPDLSLYDAPHDSADVWKREQRHERPVMPPMPNAAPPPPPLAEEETLSPFSRQPPLIPVSPRVASAENPWSSKPLDAPTPSPIPLAPSKQHDSTYNDDLLDRGKENGLISLKDELKILPNAEGPQRNGHEEPSLLEDEDERPELPTRPPRRADTEYFEPPEGPPPPKPPRPTVRTTVPSDEEVARMLEQRNETYQIKHFNWFDHHSRKLRRSSMLTQNNNGPCPLLALVNALILGAKEESQAALDEALRTREQVTLGLIIETLMDELLSRGFDDVDVMPDVDELNHFLMRLRTGMNANPRFVPQSAPAPNLMDADEDMLNAPQDHRLSHETGTFESTPDMTLYGAFQVPLVHGWLPEPGSSAAKAFTRSAQTYEDAQALQFGEEELEYKLTQPSGLSSAEENMWQDIRSIKTFFQSYPTQLTPTGLEAVQDSIPPGDFAIMFRNDHFSTIYKHPETGQLFTLITDAGYADRDEIIWESLIDISGAHNEFFSGDFMPVSHDQPSSQHSESTQHPSSRRASQHLTVTNHSGANAAPMSPQEVQEQHDADFAMALQLQEEEEQRQRAERNRRRTSGGNIQPPAQPPRPRTSTNPNAGGGNIPITLTNSRPAPENRPSIPPRTSGPVPAVNRSSALQADGDDAPPAYEEAAKGTPYIPPVGSPLHPTSNPATPMGSTSQLTGTTSNISHHSATGSGSGFGMGNMPAVGGGSHPPGPNALRRGQRRTSAYGETSQQWYGQQGPGGRLHPGSASGMNMPGGMPVGGGRRDRREDRDCVVM